VRLSLLIALVFFLSLSASAQSDTIATDSGHVDKNRIYSRARKATILSAVLPGAGQVYNRKYWKVPIIYAGLAGFGYMFYFNNTEYQYFSTNLSAENDKDPHTVNKSGYSSEQLIDLKRDYKRLRDLAIIGGAAVYLLNLIDANVDAHLATFDVSDDLSLKLSPCTFLSGTRMSAGLSIKIKYR
jgi:hypothetical protein